MSRQGEKQSKLRRECVIPYERDAGNLPTNSTVHVRFQRRRSEARENRAVTRSPWETVGISDYDPARVALAELPTARCPVGSWLRLCRHSVARLLRMPGITGTSGRPIAKPPRLVASLRVEKERMPLWFCRARTWRRQDYVIDLFDTTDPRWADEFASVEGSADTVDPVTVEALMAFLLNPKTDPPSPVTTKTVVTAYRACALRCHPDLGGSHEAMITLTAAKDRLLMCVVDAQMKPTDTIETFWGEKIKRADYGGRFPEYRARYIVGLKYDDSNRATCIYEMRQAERAAASAMPFPAGQVLTRDAFIEQLGPAYALLWPWPTRGRSATNRNETEAGVLDYTILRLLDWTPDSTPATALARAFEAAGWSRAPYARKFKDRRHFANWIRGRARKYAGSLGRCQTMIPAMRDDIPVQFKRDKISLRGKKKKVEVALALFEQRRIVSTDPTVDVSPDRGRLCDPGLVRRLVRP
jgi:hypothetical protein